MDDHGSQPNGLAVVEMSPHWAAVLRGELPHRRLSVFRWLFRLLPATRRCKFCNAPYSGVFGRILSWFGMRPSRKNPEICAPCIEEAPDGGVVLPVSVLFADLRGYTSLTEKLSTAAVAALVNRFYTAASGALLKHRALLAQTAGDQVMALFLPGFAGADYRQVAVDGARAILVALGYGSQAGNWIDAGIGISSGEAFVGNVAGGGYKDFTAVGDVPNTAARLTSAARTGEIVVCADTFRGVAARYPTLEGRKLELKGKAQPVESFWIPRA